MGKVHGSLARAGKVRGQTPKVPKAEKKKKPTGRAKKRMQYSKRFISAAVGFGGVCRLFVLSVVVSSFVRFFPPYFYHLPLLGLSASVARIFVHWDVLGVVLHRQTRAAQQATCRQTWVTSTRQSVSILVDASESALQMFQCE